MREDTKVGLAVGSFVALWVVLAIAPVGVAIWAVVSLVNWVVTK